MNDTIISPTLESPIAAVNGPKVGDILVSCSGYEACIAHFAKVVGVTKSSVKIVRLRSADTYKGSGGMEWTSVPVEDAGVHDWQDSFYKESALNNSTDEVETKRFKPYGNSYKVKENSYATFYKWGGEPIECYNYH